MRYQHHLFVCTNERESGACCAARGAFDVLKAMKHALRERGLDRDGGIMANKSGCFGRCAHGPNVVVYPRGSWHEIHNAEQAIALIHELASAPNT